MKINNIIKVTSMVLIILLSIYSTTAFGIRITNWTPSGDNYKTLYGKTIYVDDNADAEWYDETHVKTITEGVNKAKNGDIVYVYNGKYKENIEITKSIELIGQNRDKTFIKDSNDKNYGLLVLASDVTIKKFTFEGFVGSMFSRAIQIGMADGSSPQEDIHLSNCQIRYCDGGIFVYHVANSMINDCKIFGNHGSGLVIEDSSSVTIKNCLLGGNGGKTEDGLTRSGGITIVSEASTVSNIEISRCTIEENIGIGIELFVFGTSNSVKNVKIHNNYLIKNSWYGIDIQEVGDTEIYDNEICKNKKCGIYANMLKSDCVIINNKISDNGGANNIDCGIYIMDCSETITIKNNEIQNNVKAGFILLRSMSHKIINNIISQNGIGISLSFSSGNNIEGNTISSNDIGIKINQCLYDTNLLKKENTFKDNGQDIVVKQRNRIKMRLYDLFPFKILIQFIQQLKNLRTIDKEKNLNCIV